MTEPTTCHKLKSTSVRQTNVKFYPPLFEGHTLGHNAFVHLQNIIFRQLPIWLLMPSSFSVSNYKLKAFSSFLIIRTANPWNLEDNFFMDSQYMSRIEQILFTINSLVQL